MTDKRIVRKALAVAMPLVIVGPLLLTGCGSIHTAARRGDVKAVERRLALGISPNSRHPLTVETPLIEAASAGHLDVVKLLVERGADVNLKGEAWYTPLHCAAYYGHLDVAKFLLEHGADITPFKAQGHNTALHSAASGGHIEMAKLFVARGVDINWKGVDEATALENAAGAGHVEMTRYLLANGADVNSRGIYGRTPLHAAAFRDKVETARILLEHGADPALECNGRPVSGPSEEFRQLLQQHASKR